jgi:hypothetical protein
MLEGNVSDAKILQDDAQMTVLEKPNFFSQIEPLLNNLFM